MAQTTQPVNACDVVVKLDDEGGVLTDISGSSNDVSIDMNNDLGEVSTFGGRFKLNLSCKASVGISLKAVYTPVDGEAVALLKDWFFNNPGPRTIQINVPDNEPGSDRYSGEVVLESLSIPLTADDAGPIMVSASIKNNGEFALTTIAS